jgi:hypothetical protein
MTASQWEMAQSQWCKLRGALKLLDALKAKASSELHRKGCFL